LPSHRLSWFVSQNRFSKEIATLRAAGIPLLDLSNSNPTTARFAYPHAEIGAALAGVRDFTYEPDPAGSRQARETIAAYYRERSVEVSPERILMTASTSEAYGHLFKLLCDPGDEILILQPSYPLFEYLASLESVRTVPYLLRYDGSWYIDFSSLEAAVSGRTRALVVVNPNNPTGSLLKEDEASRLMLLASKHHLAVISDEVFMDYPLEAEAKAVTSLINRQEALTFALNGLSKCAGMPQMKLGWIVVGGPEEQARAATENLELILDTYLPVNTPVQSALSALFETGRVLRKQIGERTKANFAELESALDNCPAHALHTEAGWSAVIRLPATRREEDWLLALLREEHVVAQPGYFFDMPADAYAVVSLITPEEEFREGVSRLRRLVETSRC
jgi:hypothetical protein